MLFGLLFGQKWSHNAFLYVIFAIFTVILDFEIYINLSFVILMPQIFFQDFKQEVFLNHMIVHWLVKRIRIINLN